MKRAILFFTISWIFVTFFSGVEAQQQEKSKLKWEDVYKSDDIVVYAQFLEENPKTEHFDELKALVNKFLKDKVTKAEKEGYEVVYNATLIPEIKVVLESILELGGGKIKHPNAEWYSDPTRPLFIHFITNRGAKYLAGKGIGIVGKKVYIYGLENTSIQR